jgi:hypothetical protein
MQCEKYMRISCCQLFLTDTLISKQFHTPVRTCVSVHCSNCHYNYNACIVLNLSINTYSMREGHIYHDA